MGIKNQNSIKLINRNKHIINIEGESDFFSIEDMTYNFNGEEIFVTKDFGILDLNPVVEAEYYDNLTQSLSDPKSKIDYNMHLILHNYMNKIYNTSKSAYTILSKITQGEGVKDPKGRMLNIDMIGEEFTSFQELKGIINYQGQEYHVEINRRGFYNADEKIIKRYYDGSTTDIVLKIYKVEKDRKEKMFDYIFGGEREIYYHPSSLGISIFDSFFKYIVLGK